MRTLQKIFEGLFDIDLDTRVDDAWNDIFVSPDRKHIPEHPLLIRIGNYDHPTSGNIVKDNKLVVGADYDFEIYAYKAVPHFKKFFPKVDTLEGTYLKYRSFNDEINAQNFFKNIDVESRATLLPNIKKGIKDLNIKSGGSIGFEYNYLSANTLPIHDCNMTAKRVSMDTVPAFKNCTIDGELYLRAGMYTPYKKLLALVMSHFTKISESGKRLVGSVDPRFFKDFGLTHPINIFVTAGTNKRSGFSIEGTKLQNGRCPAKIDL